MESHWDLIATALGGGGLGAAVKWVSDKGRDRAYIMGAVDKATDASFARLTKEIDHLTSEVARLRTHVHECEENLDVARNDRARVQAQIDELMRSGRIANYGDKPPGSGGLE